MDKDAPRPRTSFQLFAKWAARRAGHGVAFLLALGTVLVWAITGPLFGFSDTWQLAINTGTTIVTFLMVFLIQNSQTRDSEAIHIKLDELIEATKGARRELLDLEELPEGELHRLQQRYEALAAEARQRRGLRGGHRSRPAAKGKRRSQRPDVVERR
jgi:low affinity Fe/Cu permease